MKKKQLFPLIIRNNNKFTTYFTASTSENNYTRSCKSFHQIILRNDESRTRLDSSTIPAS
jgi:hypothetical protein